MQAVAQGKVARAEFLKVIKGLILLQANICGFLCRMEFYIVFVAVIWIQSFMQFMSKCQQYCLCLAGVKLLQPRA